ncbi:hypothetical protein [Streptomyces sp. JJ66]|uniref:hypothetical protein n=1 Tax=Streptomyces sp. JJ66 TaxID=2803843 RepID=UPI00214C65FD|nr:hypothetical protein [Streptomyces sp. JJ66]
MGVRRGVQLAVRQVARRAQAERGGRLLAARPPLGVAALDQWALCSRSTPSSR